MSDQELPYTTLMYDTDPYLTEATTRVVGVDGDVVVLQDTVFYPEGGGQAADRGWIDDLPVVGLKRTRPLYHQVERGDSVIVRSVVAHEVTGHGLTAGDEVHLKVDWIRRYDNMKMHTLAHLLFIATTEMLRSRGEATFTRGCQIEGRSARFDFNADISPEETAAVQARVLELASGQQHAHVEVLDSGIRLWKSGPFTIPCGGTHVRRIDEIDGPIQVRRRKKGNALTRLYVTREPGP